MRRGTAATLAAAREVPALRAPWTPIPPATASAAHRRFNTHGAVAAASTVPPASTSSGAAGAAAASPSLFAFHCTLHRYPPPFHLPRRRGDYNVDVAPSSMILPPPSVKPFIAAGSVLLMQQRREQQVNAASGSAPGGQTLQRESKDAREQRLLAQLRDTHLLLSVTRYERSSIDGSCRSVTQSCAVVSAADSVATLLRTVQTLLQPHVQPDVPSLIDPVEPPLLLLARTSSSLIQRFRLLLGLGPSSPRVREGGLKRLLRLDDLEADKRSIADALFRAGAPYVRLSVVPAFELQSDGQLLQRASSSSSAVPEQLLLLPLNGGRAVRSGDMGSYRMRSLLAIIGGVMVCVLGALAVGALGSDDHEQEMLGAGSRQERALAAQGQWRSARQAAAAATPIRVTSSSSSPAAPAAAVSSEKEPQSQSWSDWIRSKTDWVTGSHRATVQQDKQPQQPFREQK